MAAVLGHVWCTLRAPRWHTQGTRPPQSNLRAPRGAHVALGLLWCTLMSTQRRDWVPSLVHTSLRRRNGFSAPVHTSIGRRDRFPTLVHFSTRRRDKVPSPVHTSTGQRDRFPAPVHTKLRVWGGGWRGQRPCYFGCLSLAGMARVSARPSHKVLRSMCRCPALGGEANEEEMGGKVGLTFRARRTYLSRLPCRTGVCKALLWGVVGWNYPTKSPSCGGRMGRGSPRGFRGCSPAQVLFHAREAGGGGQGSSPYTHLRQILFCTVLGRGWHSQALANNKRQVGAWADSASPWALAGCTHHLLPSGQAPGHSPGLGGRTGYSFNGVLSGGPGH